MATESVIERVAKAIHTAANSSRTEEDQWCSDAMALAAARAAIEAMREPTKKMWEEGSWETGYVSEEAWHAMIDAALETEP
jgi:hypothetical protein